MACTTILVGKKASYDGSTMIARNEDSGFGIFTEKKFVVVHPEEQPVHYKSVISMWRSSCPRILCVTQRFQCIKGRRHMGCQRRQ